jgi:hypothetical protein
MILGKVTQDFTGSNDERYKIGEVLEIDLNSPLLRVGFLQKLEDDCPVARCVCGRMFMRLLSGDPEQVLVAHCEELGEGHKAATEREKVVA